MLLLVFWNRHVGVCTWGRPIWEIASVFSLHAGLAAAAGMEGSEPAKNIDNFPPPSLRMVSFTGFSLFSHKRCPLRPMLRLQTSPTMICSW